MESRLEKLYKTEICRKLQKELGLKNIMEVPKVSKIVINVGAKEAVSDSKILNGIKEIVDSISGQASVKTVAKKSIAGFKLREGMPIGVMVTLRKKRMYNFLDKLINIAFPRVRDFHGLAVKFDGQGNFNLGVRDWMIFPEVDYNKIDRVRGLNITIQTTAKTDSECHALLKSFNMPFRKDK